MKSWDYQYNYTRTQIYNTYVKHEVFIRAVFATLAFVYKNSTLVSFVGVLLIDNDKIWRAGNDFRKGWELSPLLLRVEIMQGVITPSSELLQILYSGQLGHTKRQADWSFRKIRASSD